MLGARADNALDNPRPTTMLAPFALGSEEWLSGLRHLT